MEYRIRATGEIVSENTLRLMHPNKSLAVNLSAEVLDEIGVDEVIFVEAPTPPLTCKVVRNGAEFVNGRWQAAWQLQELPLATQTVIVKQALTAAVEAHLDSAAQQRGYRDIRSAVTYVGDPDPIFGAEGVAYRDWRSAVWRHCYAVLDAVQTGKRAIPTIEQLLAELPSLEL